MKMKPVDPRTALLARILEVAAAKRLDFGAIQRAEDAVGVPKGTKPSVEQLRAVVARLESL